MFNILSKPLLIALVIAFLSACGFGYLSYKYHAEKAVLAEQIRDLNEINKSLSESNEKAQKLCSLIDSTTTEWKKEEQQAESETQAAVDEIDKLSIKPSVIKKETFVAEKATDEKDDVVDIDGKLSNDLVRLLSESCLSAKGSSCINP